MPVVHIEQLDGDPSVTGRALAFARAQLRRWDDYMRPGIANQTFFIWDGVIRIRQVDDLQFIAINMGGGEYFEFQTSGSSVIMLPVIQDLIERQRYKTAVIDATPKLETVDGKQQITTKPILLGGTRVADAATTSKLKRSQHNLLYDEPVSAGRTNKNLLFESWAPGHSHTGIHFRSYSRQMPTDIAGRTNVAVNRYRPFRGSYVTHALRQLSMDMPYGEVNGKSPMREAFIRGAADLPRATGKQIVDGREFGIVIDASCQVHVFPISRITALKEFEQNVDQVNSQVMPLPEWVYRPTQRFADYYSKIDDERKGLIDLPDIDWKFHPDGTKICAVVYRREPAALDADHAFAHQFDVNDDHGAATVEELNAFFYETTTKLFGIGARFSKPLDYKNTFYQCGTGLVEVSITITLSGEDSFNVALEARTVRDPLTTKYCTLLAGYSHHNIGTVVRGDMVSLDIERYARTFDKFELDPFPPLDKSSSESKAVGSFLSLKNLAPAEPIELNSFGAYMDSLQDGAAIKVLGFPAVLLAADLATLSFAIKQTYIEDITGGQFHHFSVSIYTLNTYRETLFPEKLTRSDIVTALIEDAVTPARKFMERAGGTWDLIQNGDIRTWTDFPSAVRERLVNAGPTAFPELDNWLLALGGLVSPYTRLFVPDGAVLPGLHLFNPLYPGDAPSRVNLGDLPNPKFGWLAYTCEIINRLGMTPQTTFFAHANGSYAFFDWQFIYSQYGELVSGSEDDGRFILKPDAPTNPTVANCVTTDVFDVGLLEHALFDSVSFATPKQRKKSSFIELYNAALQNGIDDGSLTDIELTAITPNALRVAIAADTAVSPAQFSEPHLQFSNFVTTPFWFGMPEPPAIIYAPRPPDTEDAMFAAGGQFLLDVYRSMFLSTGPYYPRFHLVNDPAASQEYQVFFGAPRYTTRNFLLRADQLPGTSEHPFIFAPVFADDLSALTDPLPTNLPAVDSFGNAVTNWHKTESAAGSVEYRFYIYIGAAYQPGILSAPDFVTFFTSYGVVNIVGTATKVIVPSHYEAWFTDADMATVWGVLAGLAYTPPEPPTPNAYPQPGLGGLLDITLQDVFYQGPLLSSPRDPFSTNARPITFSSCAMVA